MLSEEISEIAKLPKRTEKHVFLRISFEKLLLGVKSSNVVSH
jgi:hypothetical protein